MPRSTVIAAGLALGALALGATAGFGQQATTADIPTGGIVIGIGIGYGSLDEANRLSIAAGGGPGFIALRVTQVRESRRFDADINASNTYQLRPSILVREYAVLYGRRKTIGAVFLSGSAGIGAVHGRERGEYIRFDRFGTYHEEVPIATVGLPVELEAGWSATRSIGFGISAFADVNAEHSVAGATFNILIGRLPGR